MEEETSVGDKENEDVNAIVKSVVNTIRDLSTKIDKIDMKPCPICGDVITGVYAVPHWPASVGLRSELGLYSTVVVQIELGICVIFM